MTISRVHVVRYVLTICAVGALLCVIPLQLQAQYHEVLKDNSVPRVKIETSEAGILRIAAQDARFADTPLSSLKVLSRGQVVPHLSSSDDDILTPSDTLLFRTHARRGDDEFYDIQGNNRVYWIVSSQLFDSHEYQLGSIAAPNSATQRVYQRTAHLEEDKEYFLGFTPGESHPTTIHRTEYVPGEGWYWKQFLQLGTSVEAEIEWYTPGSATLDITYGYATLSDAQFFNPDHYVALGLNGDTLRHIEHNGYGKHEAFVSATSSDIVQGINTVAFSSLGVPISRDNPLYTDITALDFVSVSGPSLAVASRTGMQGRLLPETVETFQLLSEAQSIYCVFDSVDVIAASSSTTRGFLYSYDISSNDELVIKVDEGRFAAPPEVPYLVLTFDENDGWRSRSISELSSWLPSEDALLFVALTEHMVEEDIQSIEERAGINLGVGSQQFVAVAFDESAVGILHELVQTDQSSISGSGFVTGPGDRWIHTLEVPESASEFFIQSQDYSVNSEFVNVKPIPTAIVQPTQYDGIIVSHERFLETSERLALHRQTASNLSVVVIDVESLYDWYNFGEKSPQPIKDFLQDAYENWPTPAPAYLVIMGDGSWDPRNTAEGSFKEDLVPTFGKPVSDYWYTLLDGDDIQPEMAVGRITVETLQEAENYVDKMIEYESMEFQPWMREFLLLAGGNNDGGFSNEQKLLADFARHLQTTRIESSPFCMTADTLFKQTVDAVTTEHALLIRDIIRDGKLWVSYMGHSAPTIFDMDFGTAEQLDNPGKYPILATYSCQTGAFAEPNVTAKNEDYVRIKDKGFVAAFGTTGFGEAYIENNMRTNMFDSLRFGPRVRRLGDILVASKMSILSPEQRFTKNPYGEIPATYYNVIMQQSLLGDPMLEVRLPRGPEFVVQSEEISVVGPTNELPFEGDSIATVVVPIENAGMAYSSSVTISIQHRFEDYTFTTSVTLSSLCGTQFVEFELPIIDMVGSHNIAIAVRGEPGIVEETTTNNVALVQFDVATAGVLALDPLEFWDVPTDRPAFRVANPPHSESLTVFFSLKDASGQVLTTSATHEVNQDELFTDWAYPSNLDPGTYILAVRVAETEGGGQSRTLEIPFYAQNRVVDSTVQAGLQAGAWEHAKTTNMSRTDNGEPVLKDRTYTMEVMSNAWSSSRWTSLSIEENGYSYTGIFDRGFNLFQFRYVREDSTWITRRRFDTWEQGTSGQLVRYLQDSIAENDLFVLNTHGSAWRGIRLDNEEGTVRAVLADFGVTFADELTDYTAFVMAATPNTLFFADYLQNSESQQDTLVVQGTALLPVSSGSIAMPVIGPARHWDAVDIVGSKAA